MKATKEEAEKAWNEYHTDWSGNFPLVSKTAVETFKAAYRKALEEESDRALKHGGSSDYLNALVFAVELLETVTPEK